MSRIWAASRRVTILQRYGNDGGAEPLTQPGVRLDTPPPPGADRTVRKAAAVSQPGNSQPGNSGPGRLVSGVSGPVTPAVQKRVLYVAIVASFMAFLDSSVV